MGGDILQICLILLQILRFMCWTQSQNQLYFTNTQASKYISENIGLA